MGSTTLAESPMQKAPSQLISAPQAPAAAKINTMRQMAPKALAPMLLTPTQQLQVPQKAVEAPAPMLLTPAQPLQMPPKAVEAPAPMLLTPTQPLKVPPKAVEAKVPDNAAKASAPMGWFPQDQAQEPINTANASIAQTPLGQAPGELAKHPTHVPPRGEAVSSADFKKAWQKIFGDSMEDQDAPPPQAPTVQQQTPPVTSPSVVAPNAWAACVQPPCGGSMVESPQTQPTSANATATIPGQAMSTKDAAALLGKPAEVDQLTQVEQSPKGETAQPQFLQGSLMNTEGQMMQQQMVQQQMMQQQVTPMQLMQQQMMQQQLLQQEMMKQEMLQQEMMQQQLAQQMAQQQVSPMQMMQQRQQLLQQQQLMQQQQVAQQTQAPTPSDAQEQQQLLEETLLQALGAGTP